MIRHLAGGGPGRRDVLTECCQTWAIPGSLVTDVADVTCSDCRQSLIKKMVCPKCGEQELKYGWTVESTSGVVDGRLRLGEVRAVFYLACEYCSETVIPTIDLDEVAAALTEARWTP